jgi:hypothetical protein
VEAEAEAEAEARSLASRRGREPRGRRGAVGRGAGRTASGGWSSTNDECLSALLPRLLPGPCLLGGLAGWAAGDWGGPWWAGP